MRFDVFTLFPGWFDWMREARHLSNATAGAELDLRCHDLRAHTPLRAGQVDDSPYGGGPGMVIRVDVVAAILVGPRAGLLQFPREEQISNFELCSPCLGAAAVFGMHRK